MTEASQTFTLRQNATRAAKKMIANGTAPSRDYGFKTADDGRIAIVWQSAPSPALEAAVMDAVNAGEIPLEQLEAAVAEPPTGAEAAVETAGVTFEPSAEEIQVAEEEAQEQTEAAELEELRLAALTDPNVRIGAAVMRDFIKEREEVEWGNAFPDGSKVLARDGQKRYRPATVVRRVDSVYWKVEFDDGREPEGQLTQEPDLSLLSEERHRSLVSQWQPDAQAATSSKRKPAAVAGAKAGSAKGRANPKAAELDAAAARGEMPAKPEITSPTNQHCKPRFDKLEALANAGDWDGIAGFEVKGANTYAKLLRQYRDRLLAAHRAQEAAAAVQ
jgi:hypothetical protein